MNNRTILSEKNIIVWLAFYIVGIFIWDYTIIYQAALVLMVLSSIVHYRTIFFSSSFYFVTSLLMLFYFTLHTILGLSVNRALSVDYLVTMLINLFAAAGTITILSSRENIKKCMKVCIWTACAACVYVLLIDYHRVFSGSLGEHVNRPFFDIAYAHNEIAALGGFAILLISYFDVAGERIKGSVPLKLFFSVFVVLTGARKSFIFVIFGLIIYPYFFGNKHKNELKRIRNIIFAITVLLILLYLVMENNFLYGVIGYRFAGYLSGIFGGSFTESSALSRSVMRQTALDLIKERPIVGYGLNTFRTFPGSFGTWSHDNYLELFVSGGVCAVIIYYIFYVYSAVKLYNSRKDPMGGLFLCLLVYMLIYDYLSVSYISRFVILMLSMIAAYINISKDERKKGQLLS